MNEFAQIWNNPLPYIEATTSGSTGTPATIRLTKHDILMSARATNAYFKIDEHSTLICPMDFRYVGARLMYVRALIAKAKLIPLPVARNFEYDCYCDLLSITPPQVDCLISNPHLLSLTRNVIIGGAPLDHERTQKLIEILKLNGLSTCVYQTYGMTETASHVALRRLGHNRYVAMPGVTFSTDTHNCLIVHMPGRDTDRVVTRDIVDIESPTAFRWIGRIDNVINSGALKIHPEIIEDVVSRALDKLRLKVDALAVVARPSEKWGQEAVCCLKTTQILSLDSLQQLRNVVYDLLDDARHCPKQFVVLPSFPLNPGGKIDRLQLSDIASRYQK